MNLLEQNPYLPPQLDLCEVTAEQRVELRRLAQIWQLREVKYDLLPGPNGPQGFVRLVDAFGSDDRVVEAARLTAQTEGKDFADDRTLLRYLMRHLHTTPLEFGEIVVHIRVPMDCWRQWIRHRTASVNEYSTRYSEAIDGKAKTLPDMWRKQSQTNRQGSSGDYVEEWPAGYRVEEHPEDHPDLSLVAGPNGRLVDVKIGDETAVTPGDYLSSRESWFHEIATDLYEERLVFGVAKEVARKDLPLSTFTEAYWKIDVHNLLHFLALRMDSHAQKEIRDYATVVGEQLVAKLFPVTWEAFLDYRFHAMQLTRLDVEVIQRLTMGVSQPGSPPDGEIGGSMRVEAEPPYSREMFELVQDPSWKKLKRCRERDECLAKLVKLGIVVSEGTT